MSKTDAIAAADRALLAPLEAALDHRFADAGLLLRALTHPSLFQQRQSRNGEAYERLEFLGDRVLGLVVAELLYRAFPAEEEGALAKRFAVLTQREALALVAGRIELARFLRMSPGEEEGGGRENPTLLADACEAVIGALYLDAGLEAARRFIAARWQSLIAADLQPPQDAKTALQEWAQGRGLPLPAYRLVATEGPPHEPRFTVAVTVEGHGEASGQGGSKRSAERRAATALLARLTGSAGA